jgi:regulatory protein RepA
MCKTDYLKQHGKSLIENGYRIIPIPNGSKSPNLNGWQNVHATNETLNKWLASNHKKSGVGILTKNNPAIDIDVLDERVSQLISDYVIKNIGDTLVRVGNYPKKIMLTRAITPFSKMKTGKYEDEWGDSHEVEILGDGQQFVAYAIHKDTGQPYKWISENHPAEVDSSELPILTLELAQDLIDFAIQCFLKEGFKPLANNKDLLPSNSDYDVFTEVETKVNLSTKELRKRLMMVQGSEDHDTWFQIGMALYHQYDGGDDGLALWHEWSKSADNYDAEALDKRYSSFGIEGKRRSPITARLILKLANEAMATELNLFTTPEVISREEWKSAKSTPDCIIDGLFYADVGCLVAPGGVGKTTLLLFLAIHVVLGLPFLDHIIKRKGKVLFITSEDSRETLVARLRNIAIDMQLSPPEIDIVMNDLRISDVSSEPFKLTMIVGDVVTPSLVVDEIISQCKDTNFNLIILDPVVSFGVGESRTNDAEQGLIEVGRMLRNKLNCGVLYVHHTGKANAREGTLDQYSGRGGSAFADGSRMMLIMQNLDNENWKKHTNTDLVDPESGLILSVAKLSYARRPSDIYIKRLGFVFKRVDKVNKDASEYASEFATKVFNALDNELINEKYHSKNSFEVIAKDYGLNQKECRAGFATLLSEGRLEERSIPATSRNSKGGARKYYHPIILAKTIAPFNHENEPIENDEL